MEISNWTIYWILQLDTIRGGVILCIMFASIAIGVLAIIGIVARGEYNDDVIATGVKLHRFAAWLCLPLAALIVLATFVPTSRNMAAILIVPAIANNESIRAEAGELYDMAKQAISRVISVEPKADAVEVEK